MEFNVSCLHPDIVYNKYLGQKICVPCGKCSSCLTRKSALWTARLQEESTCHAYTMFCTLTYSDSHLPRLSPDLFDKSDSYYRAYRNSLDFINYHHGFVPALSVKDIQDFFKRLRYYIETNHGKGKNIRYFVAGEYGPTTFRPHYHFLLWFDAPELVSTVKEYIYKSWKSKTDFTSISSFLQRNKCKFVHGHAERYVAGYLNMSSHLPQILTQKPFRTFHLQSSNPPIGTIRILKESVQGLLSGDVNEVTLHRLSSSQSVLLPMWRGLENRCFPKCVGFSRVSSSDRVTLYSISRLFGTEESEDFGAFQKRFLPQWFSSAYPFTLVRSLCGDSSQIDSPDVRCVESLHRLFNVSRCVCRLSEVLSLSVEDFVERIVLYYSRKDYFCLKAQMEFQEKLSNQVGGDSLKNYPFLIDAFFYENLRELDSDTYQAYLRQFGLDGISDFMFVSQYSRLYLDKKAFSEKMVFDNTKTKLNKDYLANHPESVITYQGFLKPYLLTN